MYAQWLLHKTRQRGFQDEVESECLQRTPWKISPRHETATTCRQMIHVVAFAHLTGYGAFAEKGFQMGEFVLEYLGECTNKKEGLVRENDYRGRRSFLFFNHMSKSDEIQPVPDQTFTIGDYGTADGGTSYDLLQKIIAQLRKKHDETLPIQIVYEDQPFNIFKPVFLRAHGLVPGISGLTQDFPNIFILASGCSFYSQCLPPCSLDLVVCAHAAHWLSRSPRCSSPSLFPALSKGDSSRAFVEQAKSDWEQFLLMRSKELKPVVLTKTPQSFADDGRGDPLLLDECCSTVWKGLFEDGYISKAEFEDTQVPLYLRSSEEIEEPFKEKDSPVSKSGLVLVNLETLYIAIPRGERLKTLKKNKSRDAVDVKQDVDKTIDEIRAWQEIFLREGLRDNRTETEKQGILDLFYDRVGQVLTTDTFRGFSDIVEFCALVRKQQVK